MTRGLTLIELLVAVTLALVVTGVVVANYNTFNSKQAIKQIALTLKNDLRLAQNSASVGEKPAAGCTQLVGWRVTIAAGSYTTQAECTNGLVGDITTVTMPAGVTLSSSPASITFRSLSQGTQVSTTVNISVVGAAATYRISITPGGEINDGGFQ